MERKKLRLDGREPDELRKITIKRRFTSFSAGSVLISGGLTKVLCTAVVEENIPEWLLERNSGWITAEYAMLPSSVIGRRRRERERRHITGRTQEIQRLIGRSLRAACNLKTFPEKTIWIDCDVLQADGGTRTLAVTGAFIALYDACAWLYAEGELRDWPIRHSIAAVSVGKIDKRFFIDLNAEEDRRADVDMNIVMTGDGNLVEIQGTAENGVYSERDLHSILSKGKKAIRCITELQENVLALKRRTFGNGKLAPPKRKRRRRASKKCRF
ncbi:MAG: ribonuclease PH [Planctomycetota bacterium]|jgi:ribonuclease PH